MFPVPVGWRGRGKFCFGLRSWGMEKGRFPRFFFQNNIREELFLFSRFLLFGKIWYQMVAMVTGI